MNKTIIKIFVITLLGIQISTTNAFSQSSVPQQSNVVSSGDVLSTSTLNNIISDIGNIISDIGSLKSYIDGLVNNLASITYVDSEINTLSGNIDTKITNINNDLANINNTLTSLASITYVDSEINNLSGNLNARIDNVSNDLANIQISSSQIVDGTIQKIDLDPNLKFSEWNKDSSNVLSYNLGNIKVGTGVTNMNFEIGNSTNNDGTLNVNGIGQFKNSIVLNDSSSTNSIDINTGINTIKISSDTDSANIKLRHNATDDNPIEISTEGSEDDGIILKTGGKDVGNLKASSILFESQDLGLRAVGTVKGIRVLSDGSVCMGTCW